MPGHSQAGSSGAGRRPRCGRRRPSGRRGTPRPRRACPRRTARRHRRRPTGSGCRSLDGQGRPRRRTASGGAALRGDVVAQRHQEVGREVLEGDADPEVDGVHHHLARAHPRRLGGRHGAALGGHDLGLPGVRRERVHRGREGRGGALEPRDELRPGQPAAGLDVGVALLGEEYIGVRSPVAAQCTRLPTASALAARWARTCLRLQPGSPEGAARSSSPRPTSASATSFVPWSTQRRASERVRFIGPHLP